MRESMALLKWLDTAVSGIRFGPDRKRVRRELEEHIEDKLADLRRIFPDIPEDEAQTRTLASMGDAEEVKAELARVHKPWLGWLWYLSRCVLVLLMFVSWYVGTGNHPSIIDCSLWGRMANQTVWHRIRGGEKAQLGGYTFQITAAACLDRPEVEGAEDSLQLALRATAPRFWERISHDTVLAGLTAAGPDGVWLDMSGQTMIKYVLEDGKGQSVYCPVLAGAELCQWGPGWKEFTVRVPAEGWQPGDQVSVRLDSEVGSITLSAPVTVKVRVRS